MRSLLIACGVLSLSSAAFALQQPDGTVIPVIDNSVTTCSDKNVQVCLNAEEGASSIDALNAAAVTPETYKPICSLTFKVIARGAGFKDTFGWYNVNPSGKPPDSDLHLFLECNDAVGATKVLNIKTSPYYTGGDIGFFQATPQGTSGNCPQFNASGGPVPGTVGYIYYSQRQYNPDNVGPSSYIHLITYNSVTHKNSFYFAWEDLLSGGDNDFDDLLTRVEGIQCSGGGDPCKVTGQQGKCANGSMQCQNGQLTCVQTQQPTTESCNGLDDDCNGQIDDGDLCQANYICYKGHCVPKCGGTEFQCSGSAVCKNGLCVDPACETVTCPAGQICSGGQCQGACDGVTCPFNQKCIEGTCVDLCAGFTCDTDSVCVDGVCKTSCTCDGCTSGKQCDSATGKCEDAGCIPNPCSAGTHCVAGQCVDDCQGAACPKGQICSAGQCVSDTDGGTGTGGNGGSGLDGGIGFGGKGGTGAKASGGTGNKGTGGTAALQGTTPAQDSGCGCRVGAESRAASLATLGALLALGASARRRRRRR